MTSRIVLTSEPGSVNFSDRILLLDQEPINVTKAGPDVKKNTHNAAFHCSRLSVNHAAFSFVDGKFYITDLGSSSGTFLNNFRLTLSEKKSERVQIYSQDIVRFGPLVNMATNNGTKSNCIVTRLKLYLPDGNEVIERSNDDKYKDTTLWLYFFQNLFYSFCKANIVGKVKQKTGCNVQQTVNLEGKVEQLEKEMLKETITNLEKKLKRKENENRNLLNNLSKTVKNDEEKETEINILKETIIYRNKEFSKIEHELEVKVTEKGESTKLKHLFKELEETRKALNCTTVELWLIKEKLRVEEENSENKDKEIYKLSKSLRLKELDISRLDKSIEKRKNGIIDKSEKTDLSIGEEAQQKDHLTSKNQPYDDNDVDVDKKHIIVSIRDKQEKHQTKCDFENLRNRESFESNASSYETLQSINRSSFGGMTMPNNKILTETTPARPKRKKSRMIQAKNKDQASRFTQFNQSEHLYDASTFNVVSESDITEDLRDDEVMTIEDLELDEETDERQSTVTAIERNSF